MAGDAKEEVWSQPQDPLVLGGAHVFISLTTTEGRSFLKSRALHPDGPIRDTEEDGDIWDSLEGLIYS
ncbi:hypothetical protein JZ751_016147 [Albula glossodonta]|uniref:Uncharacterized protein n=1 Tax=Albula glossodonta TaxID=121402 RepID=A0A8T2N114_9TELE|nr:hypothetical protein JZ751_016147 [Albula glossodonta]